MKKLGLVGGISWTSTLEYYRLFNEGINKRLGGLEAAECIVYSLNFGDVQRVGWDNSDGQLLKACTSLKEAGAEALVLCCNTGHLFAEELKQASGLPMIHIVEETAQVIKAHHLTRVGLMGTIFTMEMSFFREGLTNYGIECVTPPQQATRDYIQHTLKNELAIGIINPETRQNYLTIINEMIAEGVEGIIFGCTEIPLLLNKQDVSIPVFDTMEIHVNAMINYALNQ
ncbi:MAG: amino acid racemase [Spirosomataceae bacterium]